MKLTNTMREHVATSLTNKLLPVIDFEKKAGELAREEYLKTVPSQVMGVWNLDPDWLNTCSAVYMLKKGKTEYRSDDILHSIDIEDAPGLGWRTHILYNEVIDKLINEESRYDKKREDFERKVRSVTYSCSTTKQLLEVLPESAEFLPAEGTTALVPVELYNSLRRDIRALSSGE